VTDVDDESIDAFLLTLRFFVQNNEASSFQNLAEVYEETSFPHELCARFTEQRRSLNDFLDAHGAIGVPTADGPWPLTRRDIFHAFLWGERAHNTSPHRELRDFFRRDPLIDKLAKLDFAYILGEFAKFIMSTRDLNLEALKLLERPQKT
jgi:uncharacterized protein YozE (UPF0346 family)